MESNVSETDLKKRAGIVLANPKKVGAESYITEDDVVTGNNKLNTLFTAAIFNACPGLDNQLSRRHMKQLSCLKTTWKEEERKEHSECG